MRVTHFADTDTVLVELSSQTPVETRELNENIYSGSVESRIKETIPMAKIAVFTAPRSVGFMEVEDPPLRPSQVRIRTLY